MVKAFAFGDAVKRILTDGSLMPAPLDENLRKPEAGGKLQRVNAVAVDDAVMSICLTNWSLIGATGLPRVASDGVVVRPEHTGAHLSGGDAQFFGEQLLVFERNVNEVDELPPVEEGALPRLYTADFSLKLKFQPWSP